ncbi:MAG: hypothetical protein OEL79_06380 [Chromatiales bacterium]|nr:hypothetical protein [Chromatiales bacterium]
MDVRKLKPKGTVLIHLDQVIQYTCSDWWRFLKENNLEDGMSRCGNRHCNADAVTESVFLLIKGGGSSEGYKSRTDALLGYFDCVKFFCHPKRLSW